MLKKFTLVMAALVGAALVLIGCPTEAETETKYVTQTDMIHLDEFAADITKLAEYLAAPGDLSIGLSESVTLSDDLTIPAGKLVYILNGGSLATATFKLTVEGKVYVGVRGTLTATAAAPVEVTTGSVGVVKGGTLSIDTALAVTNGATPAATALGSAKAVLAAETTLELGASVLVNDITTALGYFSNGTLDASASTAVIALKPSAAVTAFGTLVSANKTLIITANATEDATSITIPAGLALTTSDDLDTVTSLTVNGKLEAASGTFDGLTANVSGTGTLIAGVADAGKAKFIIESGLAQASLASTTITASNGLTIPANTVRVFTAAAAPSGNVTVNGTVSVGSTGSLTVATGKKLTVGADGVLSVGDGTNDVIFRNATIDSKGGGVVLAGSTGTAPFLATDELIIAEGGSLETTGSGSVTFIQTTFGGVGTWTASATGGTGPQAGVSGVKIVAPDANGATIALNAGSGLRTAAVLTAGGATPTITQAAAASNALAIKENTTIVLGGGGSAVGSIKLRQGTNPGNLTLADATSIILTGTADAGTVYGSALTSIDSTMVISGITRTEVFQVSDKLTKLTGKGGGASITAKASDSSTNNIDSTTVTVGS